MPKINTNIHIIGITMKPTSDFIGSALINASVLTIIAKLPINKGLWKYADISNKTAETKNSIKV